MDDEVRILAFTAEWCDVCQDEFKPTLEELVKVHPDWEIEEIEESDLTDDEINEIGLKEFPTFFIYTNDKSKRFNGSAELDDIEQFIEEMQDSD